MKEAILKCSILGLQRDGLRFSIDEIAKSLKISKKTIYKFFPTKEDLAVGLYQFFYNDAMEQIKCIENEQFGRSKAEKILGLYYTSQCMSRNEIFNKYSLNANICTLAKSNHENIKLYVEKLLPPSEKAVLMTIIDGSLQKLCERKEEEEQVIEKLVTLIC